MSWAMRHVATLKERKPATFKARGNSMTPRIINGAEVTVSPIELPLKEGDVVLCRVHGAEFLHIIKAMRKVGERAQFQIGNNKGGINGWTGRDKIYGILTHIDGKALPAASSTEDTNAAD